MESKIASPNFLGERELGRCEQTDKSLVDHFYRLGLPYKKERTFFFVRS